MKLMTLALALALAAPATAVTAPRVTLISVEELAQPLPVPYDPGAYAALSDARHMTPQGLADWLAKWV